MSFATSGIPGRQSSGCWVVISTADISKGYIYLFRSIWDNPFFNNAERFDTRSAWLWLLTHANHTEKSIMIRGTVYRIQRGQLFTSIRNLSKVWGWDKDTVVRTLKSMENEEMITRTRTQNGTLLTIRNYSKYQDLGLYGKIDGDTERDTERDTEPDTEPPQLSNVRRHYKAMNKKKSGGRIIE